MKNGGTMWQALVLAAALWCGVADAAPQESLETLRRRAAAGDAQAQNDLGARLDDPSEALAWWRKAADQGYAPAQNNLGYCYATGWGVNQNDALAAEWYRRGAEGGDGWGQVNYAEFLIDGRGVSKDLREGLRWLERAAARGHVEAMYRLGIYREIGLVGYGVATNRSVVRVADRDGTELEVTVRDLVMTEDVVLAADEAEALKWYRKAAEGKSGWGWWKVGVFSEYGRACPQDVEYAKKCYRTAERMVPQAAEALRRLEGGERPAKRMSPDEAFGELVRQLGGGGRREGAP